MILAQQNVVSHSGVVGVCWVKRDVGLAFMLYTLCTRYCTWVLYVNYVWKFESPGEFLKNTEVQALSPEVLIYLVLGGALGICNFRSSPSDLNLQPMWRTTDLKSIILNLGDIFLFCSLIILQFRASITFFILTRLISLYDGLSAQDASANLIQHIWSVVWISSLLCLCFQLIFLGFQMRDFGNHAFYIPSKELIAFITL